MLFFILLIVIAALIVCAAVVNNGGHDNACFGIILGDIVVVCVWVALLVTMIGGYTTADATKAAYEENYKAIIYECESVEAKDEFGIVNKEYIDDVKEWNTDLVYNQERTHNFWIGNLYPNFYDDLELIDLDSISFGGITENVSQ